MADFTQIQAAAAADAAAHPMSSLGPVPPLGGSLAALNIELTIARVLEQLDSGTSWLRNRENHRVQNAIRGSVTYQANFDDAKNARTQAKLVAGNLTNQLTAFNTRLSVNPLPAGEITNVTNDLNGFVGVNTRYIRNDASMILTVANLRHIIATKIIHLPGTPPPVINLTQGNPPVPVAAGMAITTRPVAITGQKSHATNTIELRDRAGNILASDGNTTGPNFDFPDIRNLTNGWQDLVIRTTNPTTNVIHDTPYRQLINLPVPPVKPEGLNNSAPATPTTRGTIAGRKLTAGHNLQLQDSLTGAVIPLRTPPVAASPDEAILLPGGNGGFTIQLPIRTNPGPHEFRLLVTNGNITENHIETITLNVANPTAPTVAPITTSAPTIINNEIEHGEHHAHIGIRNPVLGSQITIAGQGLTNPVVMNLPSDQASLDAMLTTVPAVAAIGGNPAQPAYTYLNVDLPNFDTHTAGRKNMTITTTDPHNAANKRVDNFDINITPDEHRVPDHLAISEAAFLAALGTGWGTRNYHLHGDPAHTPYRLGRAKTRGLLGGYYAEVPNVPGEERWFGRRHVVKASSRRGLYGEIRKYLASYNAKAHTMNHSDHAHETPHDPAHPETPATTTPGTTPSSAEAHADAAHPTGAHPHGEGTFYDRSVEKVFGHGWIGKGLVGLKNLVPKPLRSLGGNTVGAGATSGAVGGAIYVGSLALGSAALASAIVPAMSVTFTASMVNRFLKWRKWWPHNKEDGGGHDAHGAGHGGH